MGNTRKLVGLWWAGNFHLEQPALAETIFNMFPLVIAEKNQDMANFYLELCFDAVCVYQHAFGTAEPQTEDWLITQMSNLETDFLALKQDKNNIPKKNVVQTKFSDILKESILCPIHNPVSTCTLSICIN
jgi:hypothetical protein